MITTAVFGGSFDPVHIEHINIAKALVNELGIQTLVLLPTKNPPHKMASATSFEDRAEMVRLAFSGIAENIIVDWTENENNGINFIADNLPKLHQKYGEFYYVIGGDSLRDIETWYQPEKIVRENTIAVFNRTGCVDGRAHAEELNKRWVGHIIMMDYVGAEVDSHTLRDRLNLRLDVNNIPSVVLDYIISNNLYSDYLDLLDKAEPYYYKERFYHAKNTALMALYLNNVAGLHLDYKKVLTAGILHDIGKKMDKTGVPGSYLIPLDAVGTPVQHQFVSRIIAENDFGITDKDMLDAIEYHTTGRDNMSDFAKLIYTADFLSYERNYDGVEELRQLAYKNFEQAFYACLKKSYNYVRDSKKPIYPLTIKAIDYYKEKL